MILPYNPDDKSSILKFAKQLQGKSLRETCSSSITTHTYSGKGNFGQILEKFYFLYEPNSVSGPDFEKAGLELKSSPLRQIKNYEYRAKERLVLNIINYLEIINQTFETSSFWLKNETLLLIFYLYQAEFDILDYVIKLVDNWSFPAVDLEIIKKDWEIIKQKVIEGKAHELSEGDTFYLGACTKGGKGGNPRPQPNNIMPAKQRAYSLKQGYVNHIINSIAAVSDVDETYGKIISSADLVKKMTFEEIVISKFIPYYGKSVKELVELLHIPVSSAKNFYANLTKAILGIEFEKNIEEFEKADIRIKTVRLNEQNLPEEDISLPNFKYKEIVNEEWSSSQIKEIFEQKFLFVFFQKRVNELVLNKISFWNMPYSDIQEVEKVWYKTKDIVAQGMIVKEINGKRRLTNFPNKKFSNVAHVRPHAKKASDTYPLPVTDTITQSNEYTKHCFWLNSQYVRDEIYLKQKTL
jgi:DNA mismatch repair protein MutH